MGQTGPKLPRLLGREAKTYGTLRQRWCNMRIVDRAAFLAMPSGTVFAKFTPHVFERVQLKAETVGADYACNDLIPMFEGWSNSESWIDVLEAMMAGQSSPPFDYDSYGRDGFFDRGQLFAVFERQDLIAMIDQLQAALREGYPVTAEAACTASKPITARIDEAIFRARRQGQEPSRLKLSEIDLLELQQIAEQWTIKATPAGTPDRYRDIPLEVAEVSEIDLVGRREPEPI